MTCLWTYAGPAPEEWSGTGPALPSRPRTMLPRAPDSGVRGNNPPHGARLWLPRRSFIRIEPHHSPGVRDLAATDYHRGMPLA
jgi:hypothetical protein